MSVADDVRAMALAMYADGIHPRSLLGRLISEEDAMWERAAAARKTGGDEAADAVVAAYDDMQNQRLRDLNAGRRVIIPDPQ